jgi:hypothetical protein
MSPIGVDWHKYNDYWFSTVFNYELRKDIPQFNFYKFFPLFLSHYMGYQDFRIILSISFIFILTFLQKDSIGPLKYSYIILIFFFYIGLDRQNISFLLLCLLLKISTNNYSLITLLSLFLPLTFLAANFHFPSLIGSFYISLLICNDLSFSKFNILKVSFLTLIALFFLIFSYDYLYNIFIIQYFSQLININFKIHFTFGIIIKLILSFFLIFIYAKSEISFNRKVKFSFIFMFCFILLQIFLTGIIRFEIYTFFLPFFYLILFIKKNNSFTYIATICILVWLFLKIYNWNIGIFNLPNAFINLIKFPFF